MQKFCSQDWVATTEVRKSELRDHLSSPCGTMDELEKATSRGVRTDREDPNAAVDRDAAEAFANLITTAAKNLNTDAHVGLLSEAHNLGAFPPVPAYLARSEMDDARHNIFYQRLTRALSAPADTRNLLDSATARMPYRCPLSCWSGAYVTDEKRCTILPSVQHAYSLRIP